MMKVLSLGAGVQSSTLLRMSLRGELEPIDCAIFSDTGWEPQAVYDQLAALEAEAKAAGVPVYRVSRGNIRDDALRTHGEGETGRGRAASMPFFTRSPEGKTGILQRQCTQEYKVQPVERKIRELLGLKPGARWPTTPVVELWFGIGRDELRRMRLPKVHWKTHRYPLVWEVPMSRHDCLLWHQRHGYPLPPRSACLGCPFHSDTEWRAIRENPEEWAEVVAFDAAIRRKGLVTGDLFLHESCVPLPEVDFSTAEERGQRPLWANECLGYCGS